MVFFIDYVEYVVNLTPATYVVRTAVLGTPLWFARGCENAAGKLSRGGKQQQGPISPNHVRAIKGPPVLMSSDGSTINATSHRIC